MPRNGSGTFSRAVADYVYDTDILETDVNAEMDDMATALSGSVAANGETPITANIPFANYKITGLGSATARTDAPNAGQVQDGKLNWVAAGGTADAITAAYSPAITALVDGQLCHVRAGAANATTTPTFSPNGLTARTITKNGAAALAAGDIAGAGHELILRYLLASTQWELLNPATSVAAASTTVAGKVELATDAETITGTDTARAVTPSNLTAAKVLRADLTDTLEVGYDVTPEAAGTKSSGTFTPTYADGNVHTATNGGAHTLAPPTGTGTMIIHYTNNASAGAITTSGFTKVTGSSFTTTDTHKFMCFITTGNSVSLLNVVAMQ